MNVRDIVLEKINAVGADGLVSACGFCSCGKDYLFDCQGCCPDKEIDPCHCSRIPDCILADKVEDDHDIWYVPFQSKGDKNANP